MPNDSLPDWERVLSAAAHLQQLLPDAVLVGGTASALHAGHRFSRDADHVVRDLRERYDQVLAQLESVAGWRTARVQRPVLILGSLDGIETGVRQMIREAPLETTRIEHAGKTIVLPTPAEMLRIKSVLILRRNATRDYLDFVALADRVGDAAMTDSLRRFDELYPQPGDESALQQLIVQLANPLPYDLEGTDLSEYRQLAPRWQDWNTIKRECARHSAQLFDAMAGD